MKKVLVLLTLVAAVTAYSQGTVNFNNAATTVPSVIVPFYYDGTGPVGGAGTLKIDGARTIQDGALNFGGVNAMAALYGGPVGTAEGDLILLGAAVGFRSGVGAGYLNVGSSGTRTFPSTGNFAVAAGANAVVQVRVWDAGVAGVADWASALSHAVRYEGKSALLTLTTGGSGSPPAPPANLQGLTTINLHYVPEPSIIGLGILGAIAGLMVWRRRD